MNSNDKLEIEEQKYDFNPSLNIGNNKLWCGNRIISGSRYYHVIFSLLLFSVPYSIFLSANIKLQNDYKKSIIPIIISSILYILTIFNLFKGGFTDPGILERHNDESFYSPKKNIIRYVINGHIQQLTFCFTCNLFRPPRCSHCAVCDNCVRRFDHHCIWLGNCIGIRNYKFFYYLVFSLVLSGLFQSGYSIFFIIYQSSSKNKLKKYNLLVYVCFSFIIFFDIMFIIFFLGKLFFLHTYLIFTNTTFYEYFKKKWKSKPPGKNPFYKFCGYNTCRLICFKSNKSYLHLRKEDFELENDSSYFRKESESEKLKDNNNYDSLRNENDKSNEENIVKYKK